MSARGTRVGDPARRQSAFAICARVIDASGRKAPLSERDSVPVSNAQSTPARYHASTGTSGGSTDASPGPTCPIAAGTEAGRTMHASVETKSTARHRIRRP